MNHEAREYLAGWNKMHRFVQGVLQTPGIDGRMIVRSLRSRLLNRLAITARQMGMEDYVWSAIRDLDRLDESIVLLQ